MRKPRLAALSVMLVLAACGNFSARLNPFNWFGGSEEVADPALVVVPSAAQDLRPLADQVIDMSIEPLKGGAIVRAVGLPPTQGHWAAELVARPVEDGVLTFDFRLLPPVTPEPVSTQASREVTVAAFVTAFKLEGIRQITVQAARNARTSRR